MIPRMPPQVTTPTSRLMRSATTSRIGKTLGQPQQEAFPGARPPTPVGAFPGIRTPRMPPVDPGMGSRPPDQTGQQPWITYESLMRSAGRPITGGVSLPGFPDTPPDETIQPAAQPNPPGQNYPAPGREPVAGSLLRRLPLPYGLNIIPQITHMIRQADRRHDTRDARRNMQAPYYPETTSDNGSVDDPGGWNEPPPLNQNPGNQPNPSGHPFRAGWPEDGLGDPYGSNTATMDPIDVRADPVGNGPYFPPTRSYTQHAPGYVGYGQSQQSRDSAAVMASQAYGGTPNTTPDYSGQNWDYMGMEDQTPEQIDAADATANAGRISPEQARLNATWQWYNIRRNPRADLQPPPGWRPPGHG